MSILSEIFASQFSLTVFIVIIIIMRNILFCRHNHPIHQRTIDIARKGWLIERGTMCAPLDWTIDQFLCLWLVLLFFFAVIDDKDVDCTDDDDDDNMVMEMIMFIMKMKMMMILTTKTMSIGLQDPDCRWWHWRWW